MTIREMLASHGFDPQDLLDAPIGRGQFRGWSVSAHIDAQGPGDVGTMEITAARHMTEADVPKGGR